MYPVLVACVAPVAEAALPAPAVLACTWRGSGCGALSGRAVVGQLASAGGCVEKGPGVACQARPGRQVARVAVGRTRAAGHAIHPDPIDAQRARLAHGHDPAPVGVIVGRTRPDARGPKPQQPWLALGAFPFEEMATREEMKEKMKKRKMKERNEKK